MYDGFDERERNETYHMQRAVESNVYDLTRSHLHHSAINVLQLRTDTDTLQHAFQVSHEPFLYPLWLIFSTHELLRYDHFAVGVDNLDYLLNGINLIW